MNKIEKEEVADKLTEVFPEKKNALTEHYKDYQELLGHIFFSEEISNPLFNLLKEKRDNNTIIKYCNFIEDMWRLGTDDVVNIVDVTILERLSDDEQVWFYFGRYISDGFKEYINEKVLNYNLMMQGVKHIQ